uniref:[histone H3]-lysine(4) N-methyltransferase n=1 Tax=Lepisosteus oculatus TaxID=7918 RepID=W5M8W3_LEPOC
EDCAKCMNCLDKPKFGGPNTKRQCCVEKRQQWRIDQQKQLKSSQVWEVLGKRRRSSLSVYQSSEEEGEGARSSPATGAPPPDEQGGSVRKQPRRCAKQRSYFDLLDSDDSEADLPASHSSASSPGRRRASSHRSADFIPLDDIPDDDEQSEDSAKQRRAGQRGQPSRRRSDKSPLEQTPPSVLAALANGFAQREKEPSEPSHKIRVDFKEDCNIRNVWLMGGLSILTSVPIIPQYVCLLCASKGQHEMLYCQVCCEPFHRFCLEPGERPLQENKENWCCRRCKFCHVCGRKNKHSKPLLECERCQNCYHPSCLGPNYPKPNKRKKSWVCMTCIRCKSCGVTPGKSWDTEWNHEKSLCPDCTKLYDQGNYCPICFKCYEDNDYDSQMMQCVKCNHWVHAKCEGLSADELYEILSSLPESVVYSCAPCGQSQPSLWKELLNAELQAGIEKVLACLLTSTLTGHLVHCEECQVLTDGASGGAEGGAICDLRAVGRKFDSGLYTTLKSFHEDVVQVIRGRMEEESSLPEEKRPTSVARSYYLTLLGKIFSWFNGQDTKLWDPRSKEFPTGMLPNAVLPPSTEHVYAQWREREDWCGAAGLRRSEAQLEIKPEEEGMQIPTPTSRRPHPRTNTRTHRLKAKGKRSRPSGADVDTGWSKEDERQCALCQKYGDTKSNDAGRLLYLGQNEWAHVNCSLWSAEVFEEENGSLMHVHSAVTRGRLMRCERCNQPGATVGCCLPSCQSNYHFMCARSNNCVFQEDKKVYCHKHRDLVSGKTVSGDGFEVLRRVYVDFEGISLRRKFLTGLEPESIHMMIGALQIDKLGVLTELSALQGKLFPVGFQCTRWYWSTVNPRRRCRYTCRVREVRPPVVEKLVEETPDQGDNRTIAHSPCPPSAEEEPPETEAGACPPPAEAPASAPTPLSKPEPGARPKAPSYPQTRRPAGGLSRPLPSPGSALSKSHHILTISDLEETRRPRRHSPLSHGPGPRARIASPPLGVPSGPITLRAGGSLHPKPPAGALPLFPLGATENLLTSAPPRPGSRTTSARGAPLAAGAPTSTSGLFPPWQGGGAGSPASGSGPPVSPGDPLSFPPPAPASQPLPRPKLAFDGQFLRQPDSAEVPHDFLATPGPDPDQAGAAAANGTASPSLDSSPGKGAHVASEPEFPYAPFDVDSDVAMASVLNAELEFDESLLNEDMALHCGAQIVVGEEEPADEFREAAEETGRPAAKPLCRPAVEDWANTSSDEDMDNYFDFSRTVVAARDPPDAPAPSSGSVPQLDGVDDGTESDASVTTSDGPQNLKNAGQNQGQGQGQAPAAEEEAGARSNGLSDPSAAPLLLDRKASLLCPQPAAPEQGSSAPPEEAVATDPGALRPFACGVAATPLESRAPLAGNVSSSGCQSLALGDPTAEPGLSLEEPAPPELCPPLGEPVPAEAPKEVFLDPSSGHFVSAKDGTLVYFGGGGAAEGVSEQLAAGQPLLLKSTPLPVPLAAAADPLKLSPPVQITTPPFKPLPVPYIRAPLDPGLAARVAPVLPPMESFRTPLLAAGEQSRPLSSPGPASITYAPQPEGPGVALSQAAGVSLGSYGPVSLPVFSHSLPPGSSAVSVMPPSSSSSSLSLLSPSPELRPPLAPPASAPILINGYSSAALQKDPAAPRGRTISINFSAPRPALEQPQQHLVSQGLPGHTVLTVREVGGPNVDPTPQVLLVNRYGQIFVKNPENNTFQLPTSSSPLSCIGQIASILQSSALSSTLGGAPAGVTHATFQTHAPRMVTPVPNGGVSAADLLVARGLALPAARALEEKKPKKRRAPPAARRPKPLPTSSSSSSSSPSAANPLDPHAAGVPTVVIRTPQLGARSGAALPAHPKAIFGPSRSGPRVLVRAAHPRGPPALGRNRVLSSVVMPPGLLIEPQAQPGPAAPSPRSQVRVKRVSSLSDRIAVKKSKVDFVALEPPCSQEELRRAQSSAARSGGVRMKTPTVKGVLDLDKPKEDPYSDLENNRLASWDQLTSVAGRVGADPRPDRSLACSSVGRSALTDWNRYSGVASSSEDEPPLPEPDEETPVSRDQPHLLFEIRSEDGFHIEADSIEVAWKAVIDGVQEARASARLKQLSFAVLSGRRVSSLCAESASFCYKCHETACLPSTFQSTWQEHLNSLLPPCSYHRSRTHTLKSTFDMFNFLASQHRQLPDYGPYDEEEDEVPLKSTRRATSLELPMAMRFRHLEKTSKEAVGVYRSAIHGRGLFCKRNIDAGEMVIEYSGIVVRSVLTDKREKYYDSKGIGCYMFRIDDFDVVDATMHGNAARFINHSCEPNCYSRVINVEGQKHIVIFALRKIYRGEELTYDYKFPIEDASNKLHCNCGARRCRRFLN